MRFAPLAILLLAAPLWAASLRGLRFASPSSDTMTSDASVDVSVSAPAAGAPAFLVLSHRKPDGSSTDVRLRGRRRGKYVFFSRRLDLLPGKNILLASIDGHLGPALSVHRLSKADPIRALEVVPASRGDVLSHLQTVHAASAKPPAATTYRLKVRCRRCGYPKNQRMSFPVDEGGRSRFVDFFTDARGCLPAEVVAE